MAAAASAEMWLALSTTLRFIRWLVAAFFLLLFIGNNGSSFNHYSTAAATTFALRHPQGPATAVMGKMGAALGGKNHHYYNNFFHPATASSWSLIRTMVMPTSGGGPGSSSTTRLNSTSALATSVPSQWSGSTTAMTLSLPSSSITSQSTQSSLSSLSSSSRFGRPYPQLKPRWVSSGISYHPLLSEFHRVRQLGRGSYGVVDLVQLPQHPKHLYAMKTVMRRRRRTGSSAHHEWNSRRAELLHNEVKALKSFLSPFTIHLFFLYSDRRKYYLCMEYVESGDLKTLLRSKPTHRLDSAYDVRFYMAEILEGLAYMHTKGWIYRDLKTDNILMGADGHLKLADYGFAKQLYKPGGSGGAAAAGNKSSSSVVGTPQNMAPEIDFHHRASKYHWEKGSRQPLQQQGGGGGSSFPVGANATYGSSNAAGIRLPHRYGQSVDYFALGCLFFELLLGRKPFTTPSRTSAAARQLIHRGNYHIPSELPPVERSLLKGLLSYDPQRRLGRHGPQQVRAHPYFSRHPQLGAVDWARVRRKGYKPPYKLEQGEYIHFWIGSDSEKGDGERERFPKLAKPARP